MWLCVRLRVPRGVSLFGAAQNNSSSQIFGPPGPLRGPNFRESFGLRLKPNKSDSDCQSESESMILPSSFFLLR
jgi:hypothetical protein